ncbi:YgaP family membrane protein [Aliiroseovarius sp.]|uniref:YgaP family membrane protein n=1 Tax=Aliiroseovarius sp. TaxID=1872442 RepID=UPI003BA894FB
MNAQRATMSFAGLFVMLSLALAHLTGQIDMSNLSWLWFTAFVGLNLFQSGLTGFCPLTRILVRLGLRPA